MDFEASQWDFFAEGGQHVVCRYTGSTSELSGFVLRLSKASKSAIDALGAAKVQPPPGVEESFLSKVIESVFDKVREWSLEGSLSILFVPY